MSDIVVKSEQEIVQENMISEDDKIKIGDEVIHLDKKFLHFNERTLNQYFETISGRIAYIGDVLRRCNSLKIMREDEMKDAYDEAFGYWKEQGKSDKWAESNARTSDKFKDARKAFRGATDRCMKVQRHLDALNSAQDNAHNLGHMLRKEMDKFGGTIYNKTLDDQMDQILKDASTYQNQG